MKKFAWMAVKQLTSVDLGRSELPTFPNGSAVFTRGETQSLTTVTLGTPKDALKIDGAFNDGEERFILHYNFPGFSTGEAKPNRGVGRKKM